MGGFLGRFQRTRATNCRRGRNDDRHRNDVGEHCASNGVDSHHPILLWPAAAIGHCRCLIQLHVRGDGRTNKRDNQEEKLFRSEQVRNKGVASDLAPIGLSENRRNGVGDERETEKQKDPLGVSVVPEHNHSPDRDCRNRNRDVARDAEQFECRTDASELRDNKTKVRNEQTDNGECRRTQWELFANERHQAFAGMGTKAR